MSLVLVVDVGTTNIKAGVINEKGEILSLSRKEIKIERPERGAAEHNPEMLFRNFLTVVQKVVKNYQGDISLLILSSYFFGFLPVNKDKVPLMGMMTLLDTRSNIIMNKLENNEDIEEIYQRTGCPPTFIYSLPKILWLKEKKPQIFRETKWFLSSKDYLIYKLIGKLYTEPSVSSSTQLLNIHNLQWDELALSIAGIEENKLPPIVPGEKILTTLPQKTKDMLGLKGKVSLVPGVYDGGGVAIGIGGLGKNLGVSNLGTSAMLRVSSSSPIVDKSGKRRLQTCFLTSGKWLVGGAIINAGITLKWFRNILAKNNQKKDNYEEIISPAKKIKPGSDGLFFLPFLTGERDPRIGNKASGMFFGLKEYHTYGHLVRAILEGVAYTLKMTKEALTDNQVLIREIRIGGGGSQSEFWIQIFSDILNVPIRRSLVEESALMGGAILGYYALGEYKTIEQASQEMVKMGKLFYPDPQNIKIYEEGFHFFSLLVEKMSKIYPIHAQLFSNLFS